MKRVHALVYTESVERVVSLLLAFAMALAWLIPNHHLPWAAFYNDAWAAIVFTAFLWLAVACAQPTIQVSRVACVALGVACVPLLQWLAGRIPLAGDAAVTFSYLMGLSLAIMTGEVLVRRHPYLFLSCVFFAVVVAGVVSVMLQTKQWLGGTEDDTVTDIWVMYMPAGMRPFGNLGQPNQLATLLLWALVGLFWGWKRGALHRWLVAVVGVVLVFGLALTQSRTGWLSFFALVVLACVWRKQDFGRQVLCAAVGLYLVYLVLLISVPVLGDALGAPISGTMADRLRTGVGADLRWQAWSMFLDASIQRPWFGYGWGRTSDAMLASVGWYPALEGTHFSHAHMLPLDLVLWMGWPAGVMVCAFVLWWLISRARTLKTAEQAFIFAALVAVGIHAMLELPLHYAYLLLPAGVFIGTLNAMAPVSLGWVKLGRVWFAGLALCATVLLSVIVRDYLLVERSFFNLRLEVQRVGTQFDREPPATVLLHQWHDFIVLARTEPQEHMTPAEIAHWRAIAMYFPAAIVVDKYFRALQLNGRESELEDALGKFCPIMPAATCRAMKARWGAFQSGPAAPLGRASVPAVMSGVNP